MKKGEIVKFKKAVDAGDKNLRMILLEEPDNGSVLVEAIVDMNITYPSHCGSQFQISIRT